MLSLKLGYICDKICTYVFNRQIEHAIPLYLNKWLSDEKKSVVSRISKTIHFRAYVASQVEYKCGHCECFAVSEKSLRPSQAEIQNYPNTRLKWNMGVAPLDSY